LISWPSPWEEEEIGMEMKGHRSKEFRKPKVVTNHQHDLYPIDLKHIVPCLDRGAEEERESTDQMNRIFRKGDQKERNQREDKRSQEVLL